MNTLTIIGGGLGTADQLTGEAYQAIAGAQRIYTTPRLCKALRTINPLIQEAAYSEILCILLETNEDTSVVVSGDTGFFSLARLLSQKFKDRYHIRMLPGISSLQGFCARLGIPYEGIKVISTHGREQSLLGPVSYHEKVAVLTGGRENAKRILNQLKRSGIENLRVHVGSNLGQEKESVFTGDIDAAEQQITSDLTILILENPTPVSRNSRLRDEAFERGNIPMTKEAIRTIAVERLGVKPGDVVYDIGAGTGSVSVALAHKACDSLVYAVEREEEGCALIRKNSKKFGAYNIVVTAGTAPEALENLPKPDKVFIGGSGGNLRAILEMLTSSTAYFQLCITAITLESIAESTQALEAFGFSCIEVECINASKSKSAGRYHMMLAQNPVYIISGRWQASQH